MEKTSAMGAHLSMQTLSKWQQPPRTGRYTPIFVAKALGESWNHACNPSLGTHPALAQSKSPEHPRSPRGANVDRATSSHPLAASLHQQQQITSPQLPEYNSWHIGGGMVHRTAEVDASAMVEAGAVVHAGATIGAHSQVRACTVVGPGVSVGANTVLGYNVSLQHCTVGHSCIIHNGVSIGQDGFGFYVENGVMKKKPQELGVRIGNDVEIGANSCIDRGSWRDTVIGDHTKIDNLVQIGHNVIIGKCCILCGQVGLGGSSELGDYVVLGGKCGVVDHVSICSKVRVAAKGGVVNKIAVPGDYAGFPAVPAKEWRRTAVLLRRLSRDSTSLSRGTLKVKDESD